MNSWRSSNPVTHGTQKTQKHGQKTKKHEQKTQG